MATCNINELLQDGRCWQCLDQDQFQMAVLQLLCDISQSSGGGGTQRVFHGPSDPNGSQVAADPSIYYGDDGSLWAKYNGVTDDQGWSPIISAQAQTNEVEAVVPELLNMMRFDASAVFAPPINSQFVEEPKPKDPQGVTITEVQEAIGEVERRWSSHMEALASKEKESVMTQIQEVKQKIAEADGKIEQVKQAASTPVPVKVHKSFLGKVGGWFSSNLWVWLFILFTTVLAVMAHAQAPPILRNIITTNAPVIGANGISITRHSSGTVIISNSASGTSFSTNQAGMIITNLTVPGNLDVGTLTVNSLTINVLTNAGTTNVTHYQIWRNTNALLTVSAGTGISITPEGTNLVFAATGGASGFEAFQAAQTNAFCVAEYGVNVWPNGGPQKMTNSTALVDPGSHWSTATDSYTVPTNGVYQLSLTILFGQGQAAWEQMFSAVTNSANCFEMGTSFRGPIPSTSVLWPQYEVVQTLRLAAGDIVSGNVYLASSGTRTNDARVAGVGAAVTNLKIALIAP
jgi:hypothetical protein